MNERLRKLLYGEQAAIEIANTIEKIRVWNGGKREPVLEIVRVFRDAKDEEPLSVNAYRISPKELSEHIYKAQETGCQIVFDRWMTDGVLTITRRDRFVIQTEYRVDPNNVEKKGLIHC